MILRTPLYRLGPQNGSNQVLGHDREDDSVTIRVPAHQFRRAIEILRSAGYLLVSDDEAGIPPQ